MAPPPFVRAPEPAPTPPRWGKRGYRSCCIKNSASVLARGRSQYPPVKQPKRLRSSLSATAAREARRRAFAQPQKDLLSLRDIASASSAISPSESTSCIRF